MPVFYPSCVAELTLRFDPTFSIVEEPQAPSVEDELSAVPVYGPPALKPLMLTPTAPGSPEALVITPSIVPLSCSVELPSYRKAGTFSLEIEYRDLPVDPRLLASASVEIYMGAVSPEDFSTGMVTVGTDGRRTSILRTHNDDGSRREDLCLIVGTVDSMSVKHTSNSSRISMQGRDVRGIFLDTKVDVRAFTKLHLNENIATVVQEIIDLHPWGKNWTVTYEKNDWPGQLPPSPADKSGLTKVRQSVQQDGENTSTPSAPEGAPVPEPGAEIAPPEGQPPAAAPQGGNGTLKPQGGEQLSFWDLITRYCDLVGAIPFIVADRIVIRRAKDLWQQGAADPKKAGRTPFADGKMRKTQTGQDFAVRRLVYGRDVLEFNFERKFGGVVRPIIEVVSLDTSSKTRGQGKLIKVQWPDAQQQKGTGAGASGAVDPDKKKPKDKTVSKASKGIGNATAPSGEGRREILRIPKHGITDKKKLLELAKAIYREIGHGEMGGSIQTKNLASFGTDPTDHVSGNRDPDLLRLRSGDAVEVLADLREQSDEAPLTSSYTDSRRKSPAASADEIAKRFGNTSAAKDIARIIVAQSRGKILGLITVYRVGNAKFDWSNTSGVTLNFDFQTYVLADTDTNPEVEAHPKAVVKSTKKGNVSPSGDLVL